MSLFRSALVAGTVLCAALVGTGCSKFGNDKNQVLKVNSHRIYREELDEVIAIYRQQMQAMQPESMLFATDGPLKKTSARQLIANYLMIDKAREMGIVIDSSKVNESIAAIKSRVGESAFKQELERTGSSESKLWGRIADGMLVDSLMKLVLSKIDSVSDDSCKSFYGAHPELFTEAGAVRVSHIFVPASKDSAAQQQAASQEAAKIEQQLRKGSDFASMARKYSKDPNAQNGGDMGWFKRGDVLKEIEQIAFALDSGAVSPVIPSEIGFHIIMKTGQKSSQVIPYEQVNNQIKMRLDMQNRTTAMRDYMDELIGKAKIKYIDTSLVPAPEVLPKERS